MSKSGRSDPVAPVVSEISLDHLAHLHIAICMRTSLEIPDPVFKAAKRLALERNTTLKNLVTEGLQLLLKDNVDSAAAVRPDSRRLPKVRPAGEGTYAMSNATIGAILAEEEAARYGSGR